MSDVLDYLSERFEKELKDISDRNQKKLEEHPHFKSYVKYWAGEHKAGRDKTGKKAANFGVTKAHTKEYNDANKKKVNEDAEGAMPSNIVSGGNIAMKDVKLGDVVKRKTGVTGVDASEAEKFLFKQKQDQANQLDR